MNDLSLEKKPSTSRLAAKRVVHRIALWSLAVLPALSVNGAQTLRVVAYNIDADTGGASGQMGGPTSGPGLITVLQGIGDAHLAGNAQPIDVLALEELYGDPTVTLGYIVGQLNSIYGAGTYDYDTTPDLTDGNFLTGNGPSGLIYNKNTVQVLSAASVGAVGGAVAPRAPIRYTLAPKGYNDHSADFTIYVSHMKAGSAGTGAGSNGDRRNTEAKTIRADAFALNDALNGNTSAEVAHIIYAGDYNLSGSSEDAYKTMVSLNADPYNGLVKAVDTLNPTNNWTTSSTYRALFTESATSDSARFDFQMVTNPMLNQPGMQLITSSLGPFGNGGSIYHQSVTSSANSAALTDLANRTAVLNALTTATDHLPVVADYSFTTAVGAPGDFDHSGVVNSADYNLWRTSFGTSGSDLLADGNQNGVVDAADYLIWRTYSVSGVGSALLNSNAQVPEPAAATLLVCGCLTVYWRSRLRG